MIRRPPTVISVTSADVQELKAKVNARREAAKASDRSTADVKQSPRDASADASTAQQQQQPVDTEHPADRAARERRERTASERIGLPS